MANRIEDKNKRVLIGCRVSPATHKFLQTLRADNIGRAIDMLVTMQRSIIVAMKNRVPASQRLQMRKPVPLDLDRE